MTRSGKTPRTTAPSLPKSALPKSALPGSARSRTVVIRANACDAARRGHPWLWQRALVPGRGIEGAAPGDEVRVVGEDGVVLGHGIGDPGSPIAVRLWTHDDVAITESLLNDRIRRAIALRDRWIATDRTDAYRLLHGEGDRTPGVVVDRYGAVGVLRPDGAGAAARVDDVVRALEPELARLGVTSLILREPRGEPRPLLGPMPPERVTVREHGVPFVVDVLRGQKTGAFLDQRDNRLRVGELAKGRRVLNLFSYAGGFSLHAALGGALHVTSVDVAAGAHAAAEVSFRAAGLEPRGHEFVTADAFAFLESAKRRGEHWDLIVSDPPSFAPNERAVPGALTAYRNLHRACADVLADGGTFCAASCSSHVDARAFATTLDDAALGREDLRILETRGAPPDHPTLAAFPEGRYLKFVVLG